MPTLPLLASINAQRPTRLVGTHDQPLDSAFVVAYQAAARAVLPTIRAGTARDDAAVVLTTAVFEHDWSTPGVVLFDDHTQLLINVPTFRGESEATQIGGLAQFLAPMIEELHMRRGFVADLITLQLAHGMEAHPNEDGDGSMTVVRASAPDAAKYLEYRCEVPTEETIAQAYRELACEDLRRAPLTRGGRVSVSAPGDG